MTIYKKWNVVEVPFPFTESEKTKRRKALVLSNQEFNEKNNACILAMITSAEKSRWFGDVSVSDLEVAGLKKKCVIRFKFFTLDKNLIIGTVGALSVKDQKAMNAKLSDILSLK